MCGIIKKKARLRRACAARSAVRMRKRSAMRGAYSAFLRARRDPEHAARICWRARARGGAQQQARGAQVRARRMTARSVCVVFSGRRAAGAAAECSGACAMDCFAFAKRPQAAMRAMLTCQIIGARW